MMPNRYIIYNFYGEIQGTGSRSDLYSLTRSSAVTKEAARCSVTAENLAVTQGNSQQLESTRFSRACVSCY